MTSKLKIALATALVAISFGGAALAEGDYYQGASRQAAVTVDHIRTSGIEVAKAERNEVAQVRMPTSRDNRRIGER